MSSVRKSSRISKSNEQQSRITEFVNVKKRATVLEQAKQAAIEVVDKVETLPGTPVKIKRKVPVAVMKKGILTPSPSVESVNELKEQTIETVNEQTVKEQTIETVMEQAEQTVETVEKNSVETIVVPAYKRFAHLVENVRNQKPKLIITAEEPTTATIKTESPVCKPVKYVPWLPLNEKWSIYEKLIFNVDSLCVLAAGRSQPCVFHKIQKTLENVIGKQVPVEQMERLKTLWPEAYNFSANKTIIQGKRVESVSISVPGIGDVDSSAALMNERKEEVKGRVQKYLIKAHNSEMGVTDLDALPKQWSQKFDQNLVKDLERTALLETELSSLIPSRPDTPKSISEIIQSCSPATVTMEKSPEAPTVKLSLLERIRAKELEIQAKKCFNGNQDPESARLSSILSQMARFTQSVMFTFASSRKTSLFLSDLTIKLVQSSVIPLSPAEVLERLKLLERAAPEWIKIVDEMKVGESVPKHVRILEKNRSLQSILEALEHLQTIPIGGSL